MGSELFDVIVVGARCAGSPVAMLLARAGCRVLLVDRDEFPSDTISTHLIHPLGMDRLRRWGLRDRLLTTGCPPVDRYSFDLGHFTLAGRPLPMGEDGTAYGPRRTILDKLLIDAAAEAGAEVRTQFVVDDVLRSDDAVSGITGHHRSGRGVEARARVVVGADGRHSLVARAVQPEPYHERPALQSSYYTYWSGLPVSGFETFGRRQRGWAAIPTHDDLTLVVVGWPYAEFDSNKREVEQHYLGAFDQAPAFAERVRAAHREAPFRGTPVVNYFRKPFGPGWALVGDAGYNKDPITAFGISDAFCDADRLSAAILAWLGGRQPFEAAMSDYQQQRDEHARPMYELTCGLATFEPMPPETQQVLASAAASEYGQTQFVSMMAGTLPVPAFFAPENVQRIFAAAGGVAS
jgi:flavin-dependent dehydrogenase